jgi:hypothetical protein
MMWPSDIVAVRSSPCTVLLGYVAAPPTVGSFICADAPKEVMARAAAAMLARIVFLMVVILIVQKSLKARSLFRALISIYVRLLGVD